MIEDLSPSLLLVVGIAGGLPSEDLSLGDVVLSTRINDYCVEARKENEQPAYALSGGPISKRLQGGIANLQARHREFGEWTARLPPKPPVNWMEDGALYGPEAWQQSLRSTLHAHYATNAVRAPRFTSGTIASSDRLIKDPQVLFPWIQTARNILAIEMESGGVFRAARDRCEMLAIRSLSDIVGLKRSNAWTSYAATTAAEFTRAYLQTAPIDPGTGRSRSSASSREGDSTQVMSHNALTVTGGSIDAHNIVVGTQNVYTGMQMSPLLDALEKLINNGHFEDATQQLDALERSSWGTMTSADKYRHRRLQARIFVRRGQPLAGAARLDEAASFVPSDEEAQVLRVRAHLLRGDLTRAHELAGELMARYPNLASAKAVWITSAPSDACEDDLVTKPWTGLDPAVATALADRLLDKGRAKDALEVLQQAHSSGVDLSYWSTYGIALLRYHEALGGKPFPPELASETLSALERALTLCVGDGLKDAKVAILLNISYVHSLRGTPDDEWRALQDALQASPESRDTQVRLAKLLTKQGRLDEAIAMLEQLLEDGPDYVPLLLGFALAKRNTGSDLARAADLFEKTAMIASPSEAAILLDGAENLVNACRVMKTWGRALEACERFADVLGPVRTKELAARIYLEQDDTALASRVLTEAAMLSLTEEQQRTIGILLMRAGEGDRAVELLDPVAPKHEWTESTEALLRAAIATDQQELTIRLCRELKAAGVTNSFIAHAEAASLSERGEFTAAIELLEQELASQDHPLLRLQLSVLGAKVGRLDLVERDLSRLPPPDGKDPRHAVAVVYTLRVAGEHASARRYAYDAYRANRSDASGWRAVIESFIPLHGSDNHEEPDLVTEDSAVLIREGSSQRWVTVESVNPEAAFGELAPDAPLVREMLGKRVGDPFILPRGITPPRNFIVVEIQSKYKKAYHRCLEQWEEQFPHISGPTMFEVPDSPENDTEQIAAQLLPLMQEKKRRRDEVLRLYKDNPITLHMLAHGLQCSVIGALSALSNEPELHIRCTRSTNIETQEVLDSLEVGDKIVIESSIIFSLLLLDETDLLSSVSARLAIARATLDELYAHRREIETDAAGEGHLGLHEGQLTIQRVDRNSHDQYLSKIDSLLKILTNCDVFSEQEHNLITSFDWDRLVQIAGAGAVESLHRSMRTGEVVWCDDMLLAIVMGQRGVRVAWTQLMCHHLLLRGKVDSERACRVSAKLVGARFVATNVTPAICREAARLADWNPDQWPLNEHLRLFQSEAWVDATVGALVVNTLREWWRYAPSDAGANAVTVALLERVSLRPNGMSVLLPAVRRTLERAFGIDVLSYQRARATFDAWLRARPLRQDPAG